MYVDQVALKVSHFETTQACAACDIGRSANSLNASTIVTALKFCCLYKLLCRPVGSHYGSLGFTVFPAIAFGGAVYSGGFFPKEVMSPCLLGTGS